jgi:hypothetical protein
MERLSDEAKRVANVLGDLLSGDNYKIKNAEAIINEMGRHEGYVRYLVEIANSSNPQKPEQVRKTAVSVLLANVKEYYIDPKLLSSQQPSMHEKDREFLRQSLMECVSSNLDLSTVYETYMEILTIMIQTDYPQRWPSLLEGLINKLFGSKNIEELVGGLLVSNCLIQAFERSFEGMQRECLENIVCFIFPLLEKLLRSNMDELFSTNTDQEVKGKALRIIQECIKAFSMVIRMKVPRYFMDNEDLLHFWMITVKGLLDRMVKDHCLTQKPESWQAALTIETHLEWQIKTLCMKVIFRLSKHVAADPTNSQEERFSEHFITAYCKPIFETCWRFIELSVYGDSRKDPRPVRELQDSNGEFVAPKVLELCLRSIVNLLEVDIIFDSVKTHLERILLDYLIPLLQVNVRDKELWQEDQVQLVYSEKTPSDDHNMVRNACHDTITAISEMEVDGELLIFRVMNFIACSLEQNKNPRTERQLNIREREAMLRAVQGLTDTILDHKRIVDRLDAFFARCVIDELSNSNRDEAFLRMRALFVYRKLGAVCKFANNEMNVKLATGICTGLSKSPDKAVQIAAAEALTVLLGIPDIKQMLIPDMNLMLNHLLKLMKEVELDDLVDSLEEIVAHFSGTIAVDAVIGIVEELKDIYFQYRPDTNLGNNSDENADEILRAADSCLDTINSLIRSCSDQFPYEKISSIIFELLNDTLLRTNDEICFEKCVNLLNLLIYKSRNLTNQMTIAYFPLLCYLIIGRPESNRQIPEGLPEVFSLVGLKKEWVHDLRCLVGCFLNYMNKMGDNFLQSKDYYGNSFVDLLFHVIKKIGIECINQESAANLIYGLRVIMGMLENFPSKSEPFFSTILDIVLELRNTKIVADIDLRNMMFQLISAMMWSNPEMLIQQLVTRNILGDTISAFLTHLVGFKTETQFEIALLGLSRIYTLNPGEMETIEKSSDILSMHQIMMYCIELCNRLIEFRKSDSKGLEAEEDKHQNPSRNSMGFFAANQKPNERDDEDSDCESEIDDDEANAFVYDSPLDQVCPILELRNILEEIKNNKKHERSKEYLGSRLTADQYSRLEQYFSEADKHKQS